MAAAVQAELDRRGTNQHAAAMSAGLPKNSVRYVVEGRDNRLSTVLRVCRALDLGIYIGEPRDRHDPVNSPRVSPKRAGGQVPVWEISDEQLWALIGAFADEWQAADERGKATLETRFKAYFPELVPNK